MPAMRPRRSILRTAAGGWTVRTRVLSALLAFMAGGLAITGVLTPCGAPSPRSADGRLIGRFRA